MTIEKNFEKLDIEYGKSSYGKIQIDSKNAYKIIKGKEFRHLFFAYHSLDPMKTIDRILEAKSLVLDKDGHQLTKEGVEILRRIKRLQNLVRLDCYFELIEAF